VDQAEAARRDVVAAEGVTTVRGAHPGQDSRRHDVSSGAPGADHGGVDGSRIRCLLAVVSIGT